MVILARKCRKCQNRQVPPRDHPWLVGGPGKPAVGWPCCTLLHVLGMLVQARIWPLGTRNYGRIVVPSPDVSINFGCFIIPGPGRTWEGRKGPLSGTLFDGPERRPLPDTKNREKAQKRVKRGSSGRSQGCTHAVVP